MQFPRLISTMDAVGFFDVDDRHTETLMGRLCDAMEVQPADVEEILFRAVVTWTAIERRSLMRRRRRHLWNVLLVLVLSVTLAAPVHAYSWSCMSEDEARARIGTTALGCIWWGPLQGNGEGSAVWNRPPGIR